MKKITITLEDEVARWARSYAAENETTVSRFLGDLLKEKTEREVGYEAAMKQFLARDARKLRHAGQPLPTREDLYRRL